MAFLGRKSTFCQEPYKIFDLPRKDLISPVPDTANMEMDETRLFTFSQAGGKKRKTRTHRTVKARDQENTRALQNLREETLALSAEQRGKLSSKLNK